MGRQMQRESKGGTAQNIAWQWMVEKEMKRMGKAAVAFESWQRTHRCGRIMLLPYTLLGIMVPE